MLCPKFVFLHECLFLVILQTLKFSVGIVRLNFQSSGLKILASNPGPTIRVIQQTLQKAMAGVFLDPGLNLFVAHRNVRSGFHWVAVSKVISRLLWFCMAKLRDWLRNISLHSEPFETKANATMATCFNAFSRNHRWLNVFVLCYNWLIWLSGSHVIGQSHYSGVGFETRYWKPLLEDLSIVRYMLEQFSCNSRKWYALSLFLVFFMIRSHAKLKPSHSR